MQAIELVTQIRAPQERCFDLARSVDIHITSTARTGERAIEGVTHGLLGLHQEVTWQATHFGVKQRFTSKITAFDRPRYFQDTMQRGAFSQFVHDHEFVVDDHSTAMIDRLRFASPLGALGSMVDRLVLRRYLERFLRERNVVLKDIAESENWRRYLQV
jgi:ligand-binding SRPBCC domain-containing protein